MNGAIQRCSGWTRVLISYKKGERLLPVGSCFPRSTGARVAKPTRTRYCLASLGTSMQTVLYNARLAEHIRETLMTTAASASASDPACRRFFYGWVILAACFMVTTVASGTMMGFGVFITPMAEDMGWSHSALSFSYSLSAITTGIGVLIVGSFLHSRSVRFIFFVSTLVHCFGI